MDTVTDTGSLGSYLNDHLAGSSAACDLLERASKENSGSELGRFLASLLVEVRADRDELVAVMRRLGIDPSRIRQAAGTLAEGASRIRLNPRVTGSAELTLLLELETLYLGVEGKHALWRSLRQHAQRDDRLAEADLDRLIERARDQLAGLEPHRLTAASAAFGHG